MRRANHWLTKWLSAWLTDQLIDWQILKSGRMTESLANVTDWFIVWALVYLFGPFRGVVLWIFTEILTLEGRKILR